MRDEVRSGANGHKPEVVEKVKEALLGTAKEGKITCSAARQLAADLGVEPQLVGALCNELKIKITACVLGCFR